MSDVGPSNAVVQATVRFADAPRQRTPEFDGAQFLRDLLRSTPTRRTPVHRWKAGKKKVIALIGSVSCLLWGYVDPTVLHLVHIVPRSLERTNKKLFILLQEAIGKIVTVNGVEERVLFLDCTGNCDLMNCLSHKYFDGSSDEEHLGDGNFFLLPVELDESLEIMVNAKGTKQSYLDMFPGRKFGYAVHHLSSCQPMQITCWGPQQRTYEHLDTLLPSTSEATEDDQDTSNGDFVDLPQPGETDKEFEAKARAITPDDIPKSCRERPKFPTGYTPPVRWLPRDAPHIVVSHTKPAFHLWNATLKLHVRYTKQVPGGLSDYEKQLYYKLFSSLSHLFEAETPEAIARLKKEFGERIFEGSTHRSRELAYKKQAESAPTRKPKRLASTKHRNAHTEPAFDATPTAPDAAFSFRYDLRSRRQSDAASAAAPPSRYNLRSRTMTDASPASPITPAKRAATTEVPAGADKDRKTKKRKTD
ncbi:uncharacterized protein SCHCODRAFT_02522941 [Schizophyllum commune H4-8]|uniref:Uncharacterized protein n=1 Tax=Schizophyllum commune (strain H4-8 / FGSC 9210) TaxID=578458 RepID=D8PUC4_SCHCM|nr:uncharacterized protein SCHCODRAFT_02522941 [Schizophyllum commune H4-8]KAI5900729.1 hypothetical protein SCHCODRAFT_02522941 [Schizophyllum commune H4-8]